MSNLDDELGEIISKHRNSERDKACTMSEFQRLSREHFENHILHEMRRFEEALTLQGVKASIMPLDRFISPNPQADNKLLLLKAAFIINSPKKNKCELSFIYCSKDSSLEVGENVQGMSDFAEDGVDYHLFTDLKELTTPKLYEILKHFVSSVFD